MDKNETLITEKIVNVSRIERKYLVSRIEGEYLYNLLKQVLKEDTNNYGEGYMVRSLYFDSFDDTDFYDKEGGYNERKKIRLRIYSPDSDYAKLEKKQKIGENQWKRSLTIPRVHAEQLIQGEFSCLMKYPGDFAKELFTMMSNNLYRPKCIVEYKRRAFIVPENDIRITLDSDIVATETSMDLFSNHLSLYPVSYSDDITLEVKYNRFLLTYVRELLDSVNKNQISNSKYALGRSISMKDI
ncbi:MAG: polyphosphate polymerase domain-containing protein [Aminipila sp.]